MIRKCESARQGAPEDQLSRRREVTTEASRLTPLQAYTAALGDLVLDARDELSSEQYGWFVGVPVELVGLEAARLFVGEALRAAREVDAA